ncbi:MAG: sulfotransferase [Candidatus Competibacteraceae bacterium]|nr:sulfotransferase [Candidatus Competibacteraceae bacterium]
MNVKDLKVCFKQYGAERTGTNYLKLLVERNIENSLVFPSVFGWKHAVPINHQDWLKRADKGNVVMSVDARTPLPYTAEFLQGVLDKGLIYLVNVKDPYASLASFKRFQSKHPWDEKSIRAWCQRWNRRYAAWLKLAEEKPGVVIRYEDLNENAEAQIAKIADKFGLTRKAQFEDEKNVVNPGSDWRVPVASRKFDPTLYSQRRYLKELDPQQLRWATQMIDWRVMEPLGYKPVS